MLCIEKLAFVVPSFDVNVGADIRCNTQHNGNTVVLSLVSTHKSTRRQNIHQARTRSSSLRFWHFGHLIDIIQIRAQEFDEGFITEQDLYFQWQ